MTLTEFLLARIAEDKAAARREQDEVAERIAAQGPITWAFEPGVESSPFFPARVLAECEAREKVVKLHRWRKPDVVFYGHGADAANHCTAGCDDGMADVYQILLGKRWPCPTLRAIALPYADHPDYQQEWKP